MAKIKTNNSIPIEEKLTALYELQKIDSQYDDIQRLKGELPMEVEELENEIAGLDVRIEKLEAEIKEWELKIAKLNSQTLEAEAAIDKYEKQQDNVKNNREYESLMREVELQRLEIQLIQRKIRDARTEIGKKEGTLAESAKRKETKLKELDAKREELKKIIVKTEKDEKNLDKQRVKARKAIEERLLKAYDRIRGAYRNGLAIVTLERGACGGCYNQIPPQVQLELRSRKRITSCEHCGRVLVDRGIAFPGEETILDEGGEQLEYPDFSEDWDE